MSEEELTPAEIKTLKLLAEMPPEKLARLKKIADEDEKWEWLWANLRKFGFSVAALVAAIVALRDDLMSLVQWLFSGRQG